MSKILITGSAGFVGSHICEKLSDHHIIGIDNLSSKVNYTTKNIEFYQKDVNDNISDLIKDVDFVIHASAYAELRSNWEDKSQRERLFKSNEMATISILEQMPNVPIVFLSSASVYGSLSVTKSDPLVESDANPETITSPYAASKLACESYVSAWATKKNVPWYSLRLVNQVGSRTHRGVITDFVKKVNNYGSIHAADNGLQKKNWVSVEDTANVCARLLSGDVPSGVYNVTSDERWSWRDIVDVMRKTSNTPFTLTCEEKLAGSLGDPINLYVSGEKLSKYYKCERSVEKAVIEALNYVGWKK